MGKMVPKMFRRGYSLKMIRHQALWVEHLRIRQLWIQERAVCEIFPLYGQCSVEIILHCPASNQYIFGVWSKLDYHGVSTVLKHFAVYLLRNKTNAICWHLFLNRNICNFFQTNFYYSNVFLRLTASNFVLLPVNGKICTEIWHYLHVSKVAPSLEKIPKILK